MPCRPGPANWDASMSSGRLAPIPAEMIMDDDDRLTGHVSSDSTNEDGPFGSMLPRSSKENRNPAMIPPLREQNAHVYYYSV